MGTFLHFGCIAWVHPSHLAPGYGMLAVLEFTSGMGQKGETGSWGKDAF